MKVIGRVIPAGWEPLLLEKIEGEYLLRVYATISTQRWKWHVSELESAWRKRPPAMRGPAKRPAVPGTVMEASLSLGRDGALFVGWARSSEAAMRDANAMLSAHRKGLKKPPGRKS